ncbi:TonB-dependent receptor domain-containing protein [Pseudoduganella violaceinigra]|uniref:TonB-dependent receptor domain-containing protein n=1 Tax=Pseudoduganella violaceinigra TaxID=246602 RepID=UPI00040A3CD0|nr:TonB-dependent receptor [Pseudoduganella violaceinigra]
MKYKVLPLAVHLALTTLAIAPAAQAQTSAGSEAQPIQRVEITGSTIRRADKETPSPVQVLSAQDLKNSGYTTVSEVLRNVTANGQGTLSQSFSGAFAGGASGISLRGLSVGATLVLIDGHRMAPYALSDDGQRSFVDISQIPFEAIERIEILKDGASSTYGSDAVAGVVNVILKKTVVGGSISAEAGQTSKRDGRTAHVSGIYGWGDLDADGHNTYLAVEYRKQNKILLTDRLGKDFTRADWTALGGRNLTRGVPTASNSRRPTSITGYFLDPSTKAITGFLPGCDQTMFNAGQCAYVDKDLELQPETKNVNVMGSFVQKLGADWKLNLKGSLFESKAEQIGRFSTSNARRAAGLTGLQYGPGYPNPVSTPTDGALFLTVPSTYPGNNTGSEQLLQYDFPELGGGRTGLKSDTVRLVGDVTGTLGQWDVTASVGYSKSTVKQAIDGSFHLANLQAAFNDPVHPYLVGAAASGNAATLRQFIAPTQHAKATSTLEYASLRGSRDLTDLQGGALALGVGAEYTYRKLNAQAPDSVASGAQIGNNAWAIGTQKIAATYAELVAPVLKNLELDASLRYDHVQGVANSTTPKFGFKYVPAKELTLRGTYTKGFRAPNPAETGNTGSFFAANATDDPILCANDGDAKETVAGNYPQQCNLGLAGVQQPGKNLKPEKSKSYTLGLILEPSKMFNLSADYYHIRVDNQIISAYSDPGYDAMAYVVRGNPVAQPFVLPDGSLGTRTPSVGNMLFAPYPYENALFTSTRGLDLDMRLRFNVEGVGKISAELIESHMFSYKQGTKGGETVELAGTHGPSGVSGDTGNPKDRAQLILGFENGPLNLTGTVNWVSGYSVTDPSNANALTCQDAIDNGSGAFANAPAQFCRVKHFTSFDLNASYKLTDRWTIHGSILNLFNKQPPLDFQTYGSAASTFYNPALHQAGAVGRFFNIGANYKF